MQVKEKETLSKIMHKLKDLLMTVKWQAITQILEL